MERTALILVGPVLAARRSAKRALSTQATSAASGGSGEALLNAVGARLRCAAAPRLPGRRGGKPAQQAKVRGRSRTRRSVGGASFCTAPYPRFASPRSIADRKPLPERGDAIARFAATVSRIDPSATARNGARPTSAPSRSKPAISSSASAPPSALAAVRPSCSATRAASGSEGRAAKSSTSLAVFAACAARIAAARPRRPRRPAPPASRGRPRRARECRSSRPWPSFVILAKPPATVTRATGWRREVFQHPAGEVAHLDERHVGQSVQRAARPPRRWCPWRRRHAPGPSARATSMPRWMSGSRPRRNRAPRCRSCRGSTGRPRCRAGR